MALSRAEVSEYKNILKQHLHHMATNLPSLHQQPAWMSLWDKYFAPGDVRRRQQIQFQAEQDELDKLKQEALVEIVRPARIDPTRRARRQNALLYGGLAFTLLSLFVTRRATKQRTAHLASTSKPPTLSNATSTPAPAPAPVDGSLEAVQALGYATLNVFSFAMASVGIFAKYYDVADVEDLRRLMRNAVGDDVFDGESAADREIEEWIAETLARKDGQGGLKESIAERVAELQKKGGGDGRR